MTMLARPATRKPTRAPKPRSEGRKAVAAPLAVCDVTGQVWTHPNPFHLYHWVNGRNALLLNLKAAVGSASRH